ncbi:MAG: S9 family peptidase [Gammaproteobacteria bacterium]|nr:S9 family peptidase [Gammaproteobacteria bacterium]
MDILNFLRIFLLTLLFAGTAAHADDDATDPFLWLEEIEGERALDWVRAQNAHSQAALQADPRFPAMHAEARAILTSKERIAYGEIHAGHVYNYWQDDQAVRGLWRRADLKSYRAGKPRWEILIDLDRLAGAEGENWIHGDIECLAPAYIHCMVELSRGGKDAGVWREFDTKAKRFVENGFFLPEAKSAVSWLDADTLLVGTDRGAGTLTTSGYPRTAVRWSRDTALAEAPVILEGETTDVSAQVFAEQESGRAHVFGLRTPSFFERLYSYQKPDGKFAPLPLPRNADYEGVLGGRAIFVLRETWQHRNGTYPQGTVIAYDPAADTAELVFAAAENQSIEEVGVGEASLVIVYLEDVVGRATRFTRHPASGHWRRADIALPDKGTVSLVSAGGGTDEALVSFESLTVPGSLYYVPAENRSQRIATTPAFYDAADVAVEQRFATSPDGMRIPYFVMGRKEVLSAGNAPTVQYGYGGFLAATLPLYYDDPARPQHGALAGKLWVSRGGVLVLSNIRGGSEYGPRWHEAALKEHRQRSFDDFIAISEDLIRSGLTSKKKLGAFGRSNGGLLMGALLTQRPELYAALDIGVPLFDMKRYNKLLAGASWMGEYGDPDSPEEWVFISRYSPYQNLRAGQPYPLIFCYTSTKDDRVHPGHARKAIAALAALGYPYYYYENIEGGHGGTANQDQLAYRTALEYAYFAKMLMPE